MSDKVLVPRDPFGDLNIEEFRAPAKAESPSKKKVDAALIRQVAEKSQFQSREPAPKKERIITKTYSLFPADIGIINDVIKSVPTSVDQGQASGSDVVRAALHAFAGLDANEQIALVQRYRGRGRR